jgi:hypothetical protein
MTDMDTTEPSPGGPGADELDHAIADLAALDPADAPVVAEEIAAELTRRLEEIGRSSDRGKAGEDG